jgi:hypothetical protein
MAQVDTSIYNALGARPRSIGEYTAELDNADLRKQSMRQNAFDLQTGQMDLDDRQRALREADTIRNALSGLGPQATDDQRINALKATGLPGGYQQADALVKTNLDRRKTTADVGKAEAEAQKTALETALKKQGHIAQLAGAATDQASWDRAIQLAGYIGADVSNIPPQFDPVVAKQLAQTALTSQQQLEQRLSELKFAETVRSNKATEGLTARGQNITARGQDLTNARGLEEIAVKRQEVAMGGKPPPGYRWAADGRLEAIPGGPGDKLPEKQQNQVIGTQNLSNAINEYRAQLKDYGTFDNLKPDARAAMGTKYNNMMLQAKEAYNLGVLNGPDLEILTSVITDPRSLKGTVTSKAALDAQASELDRIMQGISAVSANRRPQDAAPSAAKPAGAKIPTISDDAGYNALPSGATFIGPDGKQRRKP